MILIYLPIVILTILLLVYISYQDIKSREINISYLILLAVLSIIYLGIFIFKFDFILWKNYFIQIAVVFVFMLVIYLIGRLTKFAYLGEGDIYTIIALAFTSIFSYLFVIFVFLFALLFMLGIPILLFFYNKFKGNYPSYSLFTSIALMFFGIPKKISTLNSFNTPLEKICYKNGKIIRVAKFAPNFDPVLEITKLKLFSKKHNLKYVWVSPLLPFVLLILVAYIFMIVILFFLNIPFVFNYFLIFI